MMDATADARAEALRKYTRNGKLVQYPAKQGPRLEVLGWLADQFDVGTIYTESEVNDRLAGHVLDHVTLRRYLVDYGFLQRAPNRYWRTPPVQPTEGDQRA